MTAVAVGWQLQVRRRFGLVTGFANNFFMGARQRILGLP